MHPAQLTDQALVEIVSTRMQSFLREERAKPSEEWFTVEQIVDRLDLRPNLLLVYLALKQLKESGNIEWDEEHVRHVTAHQRASPGS